jgi:hypothetical protein
MFHVSREQARQLARENMKRPEYMVRLSASEIPASSAADSSRIEVWRSRHFLAQVFTAPTGLRISINRTTIDRRTGRWHDDITWDELMLIKRQIGYGDRWAYEVYPPDKKVINVANMRHLWIPDVEPDFGWNR